jgi:hypothetical protein
VCAPFGRITGDWTVAVTASSPTGGQQAGFHGVLAAPPAGWYAPGSEQADRASNDDFAALAQSLRQAEHFSHIYDRHFPGVYAYIASRLGPDEAEDLTAETFTDAFRRRASFDSARGTVRPWLFGIATRLVAQHRRAEARRYRALARITAEPAAALDSSARRARRAAVRPGRRAEPAGGLQQRLAPGLRADGGSRWVCALTAARAGPAR